MIKFEFTGILKEDSEGGPYRRLPERSTKSSSGYDFFNPERVEIEPHSLKLIKTGIKAKFPDDMTLKLYNRSSNPKKKGVMLANGVGIVDDLSAVPCSPVVEGDGAVVVDASDDRIALG